MFLKTNTSLSILKMDSLLFHSIFLSFFSSSLGFPCPSHVRRNAKLYSGVFFLVLYASGSSGLLGGRKDVSRVEGDDFSCSSEAQRAIPVLKKSYGGNMKIFLHVGPDSCSVVSNLLREEETEAWGMEPYDIEDANRNCKALVQMGIIRVADIKFPLPYREKSLSLMLLSLMLWITCLQNI